MATKKKVLFVCIHNGARSQTAEALINHVCGNRFEAESAGLEPDWLNPLAVEAMIPIDPISASSGRKQIIKDQVQTC